jgi:carbon-monoxide dehydrogenase large subunit
VAYIGQAVPGKLDAILVAGRGQYAGDVSLPDIGFMAVLRSPIAHARIVSIDVSAARQHPGVRLVVTGKEVLERTNPISLPSDARTSGGNGADVYCLAIDRVRYVGEPVAAVVADDRYCAAEALDLIDVEYEDLPAVVDPEKALESGSPLLYPEWKTNQMLHVNFQGGNVQEAFARAAYTLNGTVRIRRHTGSPMEPRAYVASFEPLQKMLTLWASTQTPHILRNILAQTLNMSEHSIRVIQPHVGGGFGLKIAAHPEEPLICLLAILSGKPVKWVEERIEHLQVSGHGRDQIHHYEVAFEQDGAVIGFKDRIICDNGACTTLGGWGMPVVTAFSLPGAYKIPNCDIDLSLVVTNKGSLHAYRGFGKESSSFVMNRVMDAVARKLGMDRAEVRRRNFIRPEEFPYTQITGMRADSGNYAGALDLALEKAGYANFREEQERARTQGRYLGLGIGFELTPEGGCFPDSLFVAYDSATVRMHPTGAVTVLTGVTSPGGGNETGIAQIVADRLGVSIDDIQVIQGDTLVCPFGLGNWSSRSVIIGGSAAHLAASDLHEKILTVAGNILETAPNDLDLANGNVFIKRAPQRSLPLVEVCRTIYRKPFFPAVLGIEPGLESTRYFRMGNISHTPDDNGRINTYPSYPYGVGIVVVEVDIETGVVTPLRYVLAHDSGTIINPLLVEGQVIGATIQGIGGTLYEELAYDENGQLLTGTFMDYTMPTAKEAPPVAVFHQETPSPFTPLGTKGAGESAISAPFGALVSAVEDALSPFGVVINETPLTPNRVWRWIQEAKARNAA